MKKSIFFEFLNRYSDSDFDSFLGNSTENIDYINWHDYCLPMTWDNPATEYKAVRAGCGLFDASPVKKYRITGVDAGKFLDRVMTRGMSLQQSMSVIYATFCNEQGMLLDDGLLYKFSQVDYLLMVSELDHDDHFAKIAHQFENLSIKETTSELCGLAIQGPKSIQVFHKMGFTGIEALKPFEIKEFKFQGSDAIISRAGFTADLGYEIWVTPDLSNAVEKAIIVAEKVLGIKIIGYGVTALNALRLEGGFIVPGWETAQTFEDNELERTPAELGISWVVDLSSDQDFIGKQALKKEKKTGLRYKSIGMVLDTAFDLTCKVEDGIDVFAIEQEKEIRVGNIPSVAWSYELECWLGIASLKSNVLDKNYKYYVWVGDKKAACLVKKLPFVNYERYRKVPPPLSEG